MGSKSRAIASFAKKLESVSHQVKMVCGDAEQHSFFRKSIFGVMSDQAGTERQFADCGKVHNPEVADAVVARAEFAAGKSREIRIAIMAITTSNSTIVKALGRGKEATRTNSFRFFIGIVPSDDLSVSGISPTLISHVYDTPTGNYAYHLPSSTQ